VFELADGQRVEAEGVISFDSAESPAPGEKALLVIDGDGQPVRWEPYPAGRLRRGQE
jgi:hypothetical protein